MIQLDKRLREVLNLVDNVDTLADIGCDHGKLIVNAVLSGKIKNGIAIDISEASLKKAILLAKEFKVDDKIQFFCGNGFEPIEERVNVAVIAGMGGNEIIKILSEKDIADKYILLPHQDIEVLREFLKVNNFYAESDFVIKEKIYYQIIAVKKGISDYGKKEIYLGKNIPASEFYAERLNHRYEIINDIMKNIKNDSQISIRLKEEWEELKKWRN